MAINRVTFFTSYGKRKETKVQDFLRTSFQCLRACLVFKYSSTLAKERVFCNLDPNEDGQKIQILTKPDLKKQHSFCKLFCSYAEIYFTKNLGWFCFILFILQVELWWSYATRKCKFATATEVKKPTITWPDSLGLIFTGHKPARKLIISIFITRLVDCFLVIV